MQVLITGATGFVGTALTKRLCALGTKVHALVREGRSADMLERAHAVVFRGDLADPNTIAAAAEGCSVLFHCAGESAWHAPPTTLSWVNVAGTENVLLAARHAGVARVVMLSCAEVSLVNRNRVHWKESAVLGHAPLGAFARSRLLAEELALQASDATLSVCALRPAWLWGPGDHTNLPLLCREASTGGVQLFGRGGNFFATTYIDNLTQALIAAAQSDNVGGHAFHVADGEFQTASEFFSKLCTTVGLPAPRRSVYALSYAAAWLRHRQGSEGPWPEDVARRGRSTLLDCLNAVTAFDYRPTTSVDTGMQALARWTREAGGPDSIAKLARPVPTADAAMRHARIADDLANTI